MISLENNTVWKLHRQYILNTMSNKVIFTTYTPSDILFISAIYFTISMLLMNSSWGYEYLDWYARKITRSKLGVSSKNCNVRYLLEEYTYLCIKTVRLAQSTQISDEQLQRLVFQLTINYTNMLRNATSASMMNKLLVDYAYAFNNLLAKEVGTFHKSQYI